jgi:hypothetical protein
MDTQRRNHLFVPALDPQQQLSAYGPVGLMDEDGFSAPYSYAEKASIEREQLAEFESRTSADCDYNTIVLAQAYADDLRTRIARFEALAEAERGRFHQAA